MDLARWAIMPKRVPYVLVGCAIAALGLLQSSNIQAAPAVVWQTTFNCGEWNETFGILENLVCGAGDGIAGWGAWTTGGHPNGDEITLAANNPGGGGGRGFRHWRGDGTNVSGGGLSVNLPAPYPELWLRVYMRYQAGFAWSQLNYSKELYFNVTGTAAFTLGFHSADSFGIATISPSRNILGGPGWTSTNGGATSDGQWHCYEAHVKTNTSGANGVAEAWIDGRQVVSARDVDFKMVPGWSYFGLGSNQATPANGGDRYTDYDDLAVSVAGQVGCTGGTVIAAPAAPTNVHVVR